MATLLPLGFDTFDSTKAQVTVESVTKMMGFMSLNDVINGGVLQLEKHYGFSIDKIAISLAQYHCGRFLDDYISLKDYKFSIDGLPANVAEFHASFCRQVGDTDDDLKLMGENILLLLNEACKLVSNKLRDNVLLEQLDEYEFRAFRACIELEEMKKELSPCPHFMRAYATHELSEVEGWFCRLVDKWKQMSLDGLICKLNEASDKLLSSSGSDALRTIEDVRDMVTGLGKHPVFAQILSVMRDHVAQAASGVKSEPASWLESFLRPPVVKTSALMKKFMGQKHAVAAVGYSLKNSRGNVQRPLGSFLVVDPSGLYWEEFAKALSQMLFDTSDIPLRITLSEYVSCSSSIKYDNLGKFFELVRRRPYSVIIFENIEEAKASAVRTLNQILRTGYASDESGTRTDFTKSVVLVVSKGLLSTYVTRPCRCMEMFQHGPFKMFMGATFASFGDLHKCQCAAILREARKHVNGTTWNLLCDVALFGSQPFFYLAAYAGTILREMAEGFCRGRLILYPSEAALRMIILRAEMVNGEKAVKCWLEKYLRPMLQKWENEGAISEHSVVFIDNIAGTSKLTFIMGSKEVYFRSGLAKKFANMAAELRSVYEKGKKIEECIESLIQKLCGPSRDVASESEANVEKRQEELYRMTCAALTAATNLKSLKETLCSVVGPTDGITPAATDLESVKETLCPVVGVTDGLTPATDLESVKEAAGSPAGQTDDTDRVCKRLKAEQPEVLYSGLVGSSSGPLGCPEIITIVLQDLLDLRECSPASCLLLGLREDGKKELLNGLLSNIPSNSDVKIFGVDLSKYSDRGSLVHLKTSPLRSISGDENFNLLELVRKHPSCVFYFDKIEKAHDEVYGWLLSLLHCGVLVDKRGNEVDFRKAVVIFGSDSGNKHACAQLAGHDGEDSTMETCNEQEKETCQLRFELLCKVDRLVVFNPFSAHQLESMRSYQVEDWRHCTNGDDFSSLLDIALSIFKEGEVSKLPVAVLDNLRASRQSMAGGSQSHSHRSVGWLPYLLPDPFGESYANYIARLSFV